MVDHKQREAANHLHGREPTAKMRALPPDRRPGKGQAARAVGGLVPKVAAAVFARYGFHSAEIMTSWEAIAGQELARLTRPDAIKWPRGSRIVGDDVDDSRAGGATLVLACDPAFALEVSYRSEEIIDRVNRYFGYRAISQLKLRQVPASGSANLQKTASAPRESALPAIMPGDLASALVALGQSIARATGAR